jgi:tryptophanyl-tRNA synthetase
MKMVTDPARIRRSDPGNPDVCNVFTLHKIFSSPEYVKYVDMECRRAGIGCVEDKQALAKSINEALAPFRERRAELSKDTDYVFDVLREGGKRAREIAQQTMSEVRQAVGLVS